MARFGTAAAGPMLSGRGDPTKLCGLAQCAAAASWLAWTSAAPRASCAGLHPCTAASRAARSGARRATSDYSARLRVLSGQLPEVAGKHQGRDFVRSFPHLNDAFEIFLAQQGDLVHGDDVVLGEAVHDLHSILIEEESARAGIRIGLRVFGADGASW